MHILFSLLLRIIIGPTLFTTQDKRWPNDGQMMICQYCTNIGPAVKTIRQSNIVCHPWTSVAYNTGPWLVQHCCAIWDRTQHKTIFNDDSINSRTSKCTSRNTQNTIFAPIYHISSRCKQKPVPQRKHALASFTTLYCYVECCDFTTNNYNISYCFTL